MTPAILLALLGYPLSLLANLTMPALEKLGKELNLREFEDLLCDSFTKSLDIHINTRDKHSENLLKEVKKIHKSDSGIFLAAVYENIDLTPLPSKTSNPLSIFLLESIFYEYRMNVANSIVSRIDLGKMDFNTSKETIAGLLASALDYYRVAFFHKMTVEQALKLILIQVLEINELKYILMRVQKEQINLNKFEELQNLILQHHLQEHPEELKDLEEYYNFIESQYRYINLRGFSPRISGREISIQLKDIFVPIKFNQGSAQSSATVSTIDEKIKFYFNLIQENNSIVILGHPGSGKTTFLKYLLLRSTEKDIFNKREIKFVPLYLRIGEYAKYYNKNPIDLYSFITQNVPPHFKKLVLDAYQTSNLLVFLDGLDEVSDVSLRSIIVNKVLEFMNLYAYNRLIISSRIIGYDQTYFHGKIKHLEISPFDPIDMETFSSLWYKAIAENSDQDLKKAEILSKALFDAIITNASVQRLATNPLLMTVIAMIHHRGLRLPNRRVELYEVSTDTIIKYWVRQKIDSDDKIIDKYDIIEILAPIAYYMHENSSEGLISEKKFKELFILNFIEINNCTAYEAKKDYMEFLKFIQEYAGFFFEKGFDENGNSLFGFIHLTFQEYFTALELLRLWRIDKRVLDQKISNDRWFEIISLAAAQLALNKGIGRTEASIFINDLINCKLTDVGEIWRYSLILSILADDVDVNRKILTEVIDFILNWMHEKPVNKMPSITIKAISGICKSKYSDDFQNNFKSELRKNDQVFLQNVVYKLLDYLPQDLKSTLITINTD